MTATPTIKFCARWLQVVSDELVVPSLVIAETAYLIGSRGGATAEALFLEALTPSGLFQIGELDATADLPRIATLVRTYANLPLGTVNATDRRDFSIVRPTRVPAFTLVPDLTD